MAERNDPNELHLTRIYDAPVALVWDAWTDPKQVAQWWGPRGFTLTTHSKDLRPGGHWAYTMHGPDGTDYPNKTLYHEVVKHSRLVYDHGGNDDRPPLFRVTVVFTELGGKTKMDMTMRLPSPEAANETRKFIKRAGGDSTWDRLGEYLEQERKGKQPFIINRSFEAPIEKVFSAWTDPRQLAQWLPPTGFGMEILRGEIAQGSGVFFKMSNGTMTMYGRTRYLEIQRPERVAYTQQFCDERENVARHPGAPTWPATMLTVVTFAAEGPARTRVTLQTEAYETTAAVELETFVKERAGMTRGWTGSFDKLDALLEQAK